MTELGQRSDFWSRRRAAVRAEAEAEDAALRAAEAEMEITAREAEAAELSDEEILAKLGLPDPDKMGQGDDFAAFLKSAVPERLRRRALRRLWRSNPVLANLDGLIDHGEDFTDRAVVVPDMASAYQVGRGMMRHVMALAEAEDRPEDAAPAEEFDAAASIDEAVDDAPEEMAAGDPEPAPQPRRHMRFTFAEDPISEVHP